MPDSDYSTGAIDFTCPTCVTAETVHIATDATPLPTSKLDLEFLELRKWADQYIAGFRKEPRP